MWARPPQCDHHPHADCCRDKSASPLASEGVPTQKKMMRRQRSLWTLVGKSADPPKGLEIYVAQQSVDGVPTQTMMALRIPKKSKAIAILDAELAKADAKAGRLKN